MFERVERLGGGDEKNDWKERTREVFQRCVATRCNYLAKAYRAVGARPCPLQNML